MADATGNQHESSLGAILGWGGLAVFAIVFAYMVGAPLITGERWADKKNDAIELVKNSKPSGAETLYDMIRGFSLRAKDQDVYVGEFSWDAIQRDGPEYEVTLLWTEGSEKKVALWRVNLKTKEIRPQGNEASGLPQRIAAGLRPKA
jgi:hypothetical protein